MFAVLFPKAKIFLDVTSYPTIAVEIALDVVVGLLISLPI